MHDYFIQLVSAASKKIILALSPKLQKYAFDNVCKNLSNYIQEKPLLEALSKSQNREHIAALSQIIQTNLISHNDSEFWKNLYEGIDKKYMKKRDKEIIQSILKDELDETETVE